ncbi:transposase [Desulfamplus magnetovallimortis]|uniref:Transposase n=1 Tax=Desulfamplus magnetovallimortis TaxID=1246637 RepID=A0A1W1HLE3_9BACT|nr:IS1380 family transposase [Desulfamplus magnetovallimortis]SLM33168.1 transposase [Desulfamplus magnetovallimortis]
MHSTITIKHGNEKLVSQSGLLPVGALLEYMQLAKRLKIIPGVHCVDPTIPHGDILSSMIGLICTGKSDYSSIEIFREDQWFFTKALGISACPSQSTLRQRIDLIGESANKILKDASAAMIREKAPAISGIKTSAGYFIPLDIDVSPFDNSKTQKEKVSRTYKNFDDYAPILAYLGNEGYLVDLKLREGKQHCQKNTPEFIRETLTYVREITQLPVLVRLDSGNDSQDNFIIGDEFQNIHFLVKRNLRKEPLKAWLELAQNTDNTTCTRYNNKTVWIGQTLTGIKGNSLPHSITFKVTERYEKKGELLMFPELEVETYWCTLSDLPPGEVINLYHDHGTSEQFHSEIKSDLGVERFPSCHFASNSLILHLTLLAYNILRIIGQTSIEGQNDEPLPCNRHKQVTRRRLRTVMQDLIYMAGRLIYSSRQWFISFGIINPFARLADRVLQRLRYCPG